MVVPLAMLFITTVERSTPSINEGTHPGSSSLQLSSTSILPCVGKTRSGTFVAAAQVVAVLCAGDERNTWSDFGLESREFAH